MSFIDFLTEYTITGYRSPKTAQEKRNSSDSDELAPNIRAKRNKKNLPSTYDDKPTHTERNWKKYRKDQYKLKENYELYHDTYTSAIQAARDIATRRGYVIDDEEAMQVIGMGPRKPSPGETNDLHLNLYHENGKQARERLHLQVYNRGTEQHPYELNVYIS